MKIKIINKLILCFIVGFVAVGCSKTGETYKEYLKQGEVYYPGRIDSLSIIPGNQRAILRFQMTTDPKVKSFKVFLRNSLSPNITVLDFPIESNDFGMIKEYELNNLDEATYSINVRTYASAVDSSRAVAANQFIYGNRYASTLINRSFVSFNKTNPSTPFIVFARETNLPRPGTFYPMQYTEVQYETVSGEIKISKATPYEEYASLVDVKPGSLVKYRTVYMPVKNSIDLFYTDYKEVQFN
ncbi:MAG: DUF4998 domain-containing protein [Bacteroidia bacterium]|nr:MAG: DUF4998 domain-containing protein [Bacteroidia bacterium]